MDDKVTTRNRASVPIEHKLLLTLGEAAAYTGIGEKRLRELSHDPEWSEIVVDVGLRRMFKRQLLEEYVIDVFSGC